MIVYCIYSNILSSNYLLTLLLTVKYVKKENLLQWRNDFKFGISKQTPNITPSSPLYPMRHSKDKNTLHKTMQFHNNYYDIFIHYVL